MMFSDDVEGWDEGTGWGLKEGGYVYNYDLFAFLYGRNQQNIVKISKTNYINIDVYTFFTILLFSC